MVPTAPEQYRANQRGVLTPVWTEPPGKRHALCTTVRVASLERPIHMDSSIGAFLSALEAWAVGQPDILAVAIIGSHARGRARPDSDIDIVIIADDPDRYLDTSSWLDCCGHVLSIANEDWG